jgi:hypothetical protein
VTRPTGRRRPPLPAMEPGPDGYPVLPPGRYTCTRRQFENRFVKGHDPRRRALVADVDAYADQQARHGLVVSSYWIAGSFVSGKDRPGDVDFTAVIDGPASSPDPVALSDFTNPRDHWAHHIHPDVGRLLKLDAFGIVKLPDGHPQQRVYYELRGYWDDWWQRSRATGQALARGYVEVVDWR